MCNGYFYNDEETEFLSTKICGFGFKTLNVFVRFHNKNKLNNEKRWTEEFQIMCLLNRKHHERVKQPTQVDKKPTLHRKTMQATLLL